MKKPKTAKDYLKMTASQLIEATREFDKPLPPSRMRPLSPKQRVVFEKAISRYERHTIVLETEGRELKLSLDTALAKKVNAYAAKNNTTLPEMIVKGLHGLIAFG